MIFLRKKFPNLQFYPFYSGSKKYAYKIHPKNLSTSISDVKGPKNPFNITGRVRIYSQGSVKMELKWPIDKNCARSMGGGAL